MSEEKYIVLSRFQYFQYHFFNNTEEAIEKAKIIERANFKEGFSKKPDKPRIFKIAEEINWQDEKVEEDKRIKVIFSLRDLGDILDFLDIQNIDYDIYVSPKAKKGVVSGIYLNTEKDFWTLKNTFTNYLCGFEIGYKIQKVNKWLY